MNFYTNVLPWVYHLFVRSLVHGERHNFKIKYRPTLYSPVNKHTGYNTLEGVPVLPTEFDSIKEAKEWVESHKNQPELVYGNTQYSYNYISDTYTETIDWELDKILMVTIDIECSNENGFPSPTEAE